MDITQEYLNEKFDKIDQKFQASDDKFEELLKTIKIGFDACATKDEMNKGFQQLRAEMTTKTEMKKEFDDLQFQISQLAETVKEFVETVKKQDAEYVELKVKYHELEQRVAKLEGLQPAVS